MATAHHEVIRYPHDFAPKNRANVSPSGNEGIREPRVGIISPS
jgi:hypothetical protein